MRRKIWTEIDKLDCCAGASPASEFGVVFWHGDVFRLQMFVLLGPGSFLAFGDVMCALAAVVFAALWYIGSRTPRHIGQLISPLLPVYVGGPNEGIQGHPLATQITSRVREGDRDRGQK